MKPIPACIHRLTIDGHLWCQHPRVAIGWANNFLDIGPTGKIKERPERCANCSLANSQVDQPRTPPTAFITLDGLRANIEALPTAGQSLAQLAEKTTGAGTELYRIFKLELGIDKFDCGGCARTLRWMNKIGPEKCREQIGEIVRQIEANKKSAGIDWLTTIKAAKNAALMGCFSLRDLVDEAIGRAEVKAIA